MCDWSSGVCSSVRFGFADINRDNFDPAIGDDPNFSARGRSERLSYSLDWSALGGDRLRLLAGAEREWTHALTSSAFSSDRGKTAITSFWGMLVGRPTESLSKRDRKSTRLNSSH